MTQAGHILVHAQVPHDLHDKAKAVALTEERTMSSIVRRALSAYCDARRLESSDHAATV